MFLHLPEWFGCSKFIKMRSQYIHQQDGEGDTLRHISKQANHSRDKTAADSENNASFPCDRRVT